MRVRVEQVRVLAPTRYEVTIRGGPGRARATWGVGSEPIEGRAYDVEFDISDLVELGRNASISDPDQWELSTTDSVVTLRGMVEAVDDDGVIYFRLSSDCLIMIESHGEAPLAGSWLCLAVPVSELAVTAQGVSRRGGL